MPELPEVEVVRRQLATRLEGQILTRVQIHDPLIVDEAVATHAPCKITKVERRGKFLFFHTPTHVIETHLRMTGSFTFELQQKPAAKLILPSAVLNFLTIRRFSRMKLLTQAQYQQRLAHLGPEPLALAWADFVEQSQTYSKANIKNTLLNQKFIAGVGNIYAQEALHRAGIDPRKQIKAVSKKRLRNLHFHLVQILNEAIVANGTSINNYKHVGGKGNYQHYLRVYRKITCQANHKIKKVQLGGRITYYCPCQR